MLRFIKASSDDEKGIQKLSAMAAEIIKDYYDPIIGPDQNDYMIEMFQSPEGLKRQIDANHSVYTIERDGRGIGFLAFYPKKTAMYIDKFYLHKDERKKGLGKEVLEFVKENARAENFRALELNVNKHNPSIAAYEKMGFKRIRAEVNDIGGGFVMDDYVYRLEF